MQLTSFFNSLWNKIQAKKPKKRSPNYTQSPPKYTNKIQISSLNLPPTEDLSIDHLTVFSANIKSSNILARNVVQNANIATTLLDRDAVIKNTHIFSEKLAVEGNITNQMSSGRCWIFAATNVMRLCLMKKFEMEEFELSQNFVFFYDKLEKANYFLETMIELAPTELDPDSRLIQHLFEVPVNDGGQWDMLVNIVEKYGVVPQSVYPETYNSSNSSQLNWIVTKKLREYGIKIRSLLQDKKTTIEEVRTLKIDMMSEIYRVLVTSLGEPPKVFDWRFVNQKEEYVHLRNLTPTGFYNELIKPDLGHGVERGVGAMVSLVNDPRHPYWRKMEVLHLGNVYGGNKVTYLNVPIEYMKEASVSVLKQGEPVWFGCDVGKFFDKTHGILDLYVIDYKSAFGIDVVTNMSKAERLQYHESLMTHAMVFTGVEIDDDNDRTERWRVQNSWGLATGKKGFEVMSDEWFDEYVYQIVVDKSYLKDVYAMFEKHDDGKIILLPAWDPMGSLA